MVNQKKDNNKKLYIATILIILLTILAGVLLGKKKEPLAPNAEDKEAVDAYINNNITLSLQSMEERDRMEYYVAIFLGYVEGGEYEKAYNLLYEDFKQNYFPTLESFEQYLPTIFSEMSNIEHENIERNGDIYVLWLSITDAVNGKPGEQKKMNIVIQEENYNDCAISFSVI